MHTVVTLNNKETTLAILNFTTCLDTFSPPVKHFQNLLVMRVIGMDEFQIY